MKIDIDDILEIPEGVDVKLNDDIFEVSGQKGTLKRMIKNPKITFDIKENQIILSAKKSTKMGKKAINTYKAHLKNLFTGAKEGYIYKLKICASHFPMNVSVENNTLIIKNFIGEKTPRRLKLKEGVSVKVDGSEILVEGVDKELVGQTAADIENLTKRPGFDKRVFQDGIYIIEKAGKIIK